MLTKRIIPCLDVKDGLVVKGVKFRQHEVIGEILPLVEKYVADGADELVFYDITASVENRSVDTRWIEKIADKINIPFCVAGGIRNLDHAKSILYAGADKISLNSPAIENPNLIDELAHRFGIQCIVIGIDSIWHYDDYYINKYTGSEQHTVREKRKTFDWIKEVQHRGAGEIVLNCMSSDGTRIGYDLKQLSLARAITQVPLVASGGAGSMAHFVDVFKITNVDGALAASVFHKEIIKISNLKAELGNNNINIRP